MEKGHQKHNVTMCNTWHQICNFISPLKNKHHFSWGQSRAETSWDKFCFFFGLMFNLFSCFQLFREKNNHIFRKIFQHFVFSNYIILYNKTYAKICYKSYNNYKCHHRNKINNLPIKKLLTYLLNCNKGIKKNVRDNDSSDGIKQLLK